VVRVLRDPKIEDHGVRLVLAKSKTIFEKVT
jgi:hypothetical protein